ncbi:MAG: hypothetical protein WCI05_03050 [Myxococcales bacterium]
MIKKLRGLKAIVQDVVEHGSLAVEKVQKETSNLPFDALELIPPLAVPIRGVRAIHDASVATVYGMIRLVNRVVGETVDVVLDGMEKVAESEAEILAAQETTDIVVAGTVAAAEPAERPTLPEGVALVSETLPSTAVDSEH